MIQPITFKENPIKTNKSSTPPNKENFKDLLAKEGIQLPELSPAEKAVGNGLLWAVFGLATDRLFNLMPFNMFKTSAKQSLIINSGIGLVAGVFTYFRAKKATSNENNRSEAKSINA